ncbi:hypothetical protein HED60_10090 [Planctomycetales bacterium ZRK34]|nr:hypothetical protein HED60_10090 [Planctomycetales bacterium ZRK34]
MLKEKKVYTWAIGALMAAAATSAQAAYTVEITGGDPMDFGRVILHANPSMTATVTKSGGGSGSYSVGGFDSGITVDNPNVNGGSGATNDLTVTLVDNASGSGSLGAKSWTVDITSDGAGNTDLAVNATVIDNRVITAAPVSFGKVLVGADKTVAGVSLSSTAAHSVATDVQLQAAGGSDTDANGTFTLGAGSAVTFDGTTTSTTRSLTGSFNASGVYTTVASGISGATASVESLTGEALQDVAITYSADVYEAASLSYNNSGMIAAGGSIQITNAAASGDQRAAARIVSVAMDGQSSGWNVVGTLVPNMTIAADNTISGTAGFNASGKLNGTYIGQVTVGLQHADQTIAGTAANDLGSATWMLQTTVTGISADNGFGQVRSGQDYQGFGLTRDSGDLTTVQLLGGVAGDDKDLTIDFADATHPWGVSDVVELTGTGSDLIVLQISYDPTNVVDESALMLGWFDTTLGYYVNAVYGNSDDGASAQRVIGAYDENEHFQLGYHGVDTVNDVVWAVIDHNSEFAAVPVPTPGALPAGLMMLCGMIARRRPRRGSK